jgi:diadenosine tetraphosphatase ApaH/serine/threonine PP2A family protein phosphatase
MPTAEDRDLSLAYRPLAAKAAVYGHIYPPLRSICERDDGANCGGVGMPWDGDPRASYLLIDDDTPAAVCEPRKIAQTGRYLNHETVNVIQRLHATL